MSPADLFQQVMRGDASVLVDKLGSLATGTRMLGEILASKRVYELETVDIVDVPSMWLVHGDTPKRQDQLSSGQKIVTFVSILLLDRRGPFVADQPENDVAAKYLAERLCPEFADTESNGQYIIVTHVGNVPILGGAHRVISMRTDGAHGWVGAVGEPKAVLEPMEDNLEGGKDAFEKRKKFYEV